jgi:hypothetical protein
MPVDHTHIVPAMYLRQWADQTRCVQTVLVRQGKELHLPIKSVGVRGGGYYKRERPSGERSDDVETVSIQSIESNAAPILHEFEDRWPLSGDDKVAFALFVGLQLVRGPRWFGWQDNFTVENLTKYRQEGRFAPEPGQDASEEEIFRANLEHFQKGSTESMMTMLRLAAKIGSCIGSMNWTLLQFGPPVLAASDHPVVVWPATEAGRKAEPTEAGKIGVANLLEVRFPISPSSAIVMCWRDRPDTREPIAGHRLQADNLNAFTIAEAEEQWFYQPGARRPRKRSGHWLPLAPELAPGYSVLAAARSQVRQRVYADLQARLGDTNTPFSRLAQIHYQPHDTHISVSGPPATT